MQIKTTRYHYTPVRMVKIKSENSLVVSNKTKHAIPI